MVGEMMMDLLETLTDELGAVAVLTGADAEEKSQGAWAPMGTPLAIIRPANTQEVSRVMELAHAAGQKVIAWGGKTGLVEGGHADGELALSLERLNAIDSIDPIGGTMSVQAGVPLQKVCEAAEEAGFFFPLDLGARGSATIGGNIATNAGGNRVIRYGMTRALVLGLEAVLADGTIVSSMNRLIKNNAGYDLKQLFIGTEGTLGIVTRAVVRLHSKPLSQDTGLVGVESFENLPKLLRHMEARLGGTLSAYEVMWDGFYQLVTNEPAAGRSPLEGRYPYYVLVEAMGGDQEADTPRFEHALMGALEEGIICDAVIAKSDSERGAMWALRDDVGQVLHHYPIFTFDVSLPIADMEAYVAGLETSFDATWPDNKLFVFGHLGDGNLHVIIGVGDESPATRKAVEQIVYAPLQKIGGSVSAEHGIGLEKREYLALSRGPEEIALMRLLKKSLDPKGILNPGKVLSPEN